MMLALFHMVYPERIMAFGSHDSPLIPTLHSPTVMTMILLYFLNMMRIMNHGTVPITAERGRTTYGIMPPALKNGRYVLNPARAERQQR
jgi:hypothetical protein